MSSCLTAHQHIIGHFSAIAYQVDVAQELEIFVARRRVERVELDEDEVEVELEDRYGAAGERVVEPDEGRVVQQEDGREAKSPRVQVALCRDDLVQRVDVIGRRQRHHVA